jgi:hypothetical protein
MECQWQQEQAHQYLAVSCALLLSNCCFRLRGEVVFVILDFFKNTLQQYFRHRLTVLDGIEGGLVAHLAAAALKPSCTGLLSGDDINPHFSHVTHVHP